MRISLRLFIALCRTALQKKKEANSFVHLATILISDSTAPGMLSQLSPVINTVAKRAQEMGPKDGHSISIAVGYKAVNSLVYHAKTPIPLLGPYYELST